MSCITFIIDRYFQKALRVRIGYDIFDESFNSCVLTQSVAERNVHSYARDSLSLLCGKEAGV